MSTTTTTTLSNGFQRGFVLANPRTGEFYNSGTCTWSDQAFVTAEIPAHGHWVGYYYNSEREDCENPRLEELMRDHPQSRRLSTREALDRGLKITVEDAR